MPDLTKLYNYGKIRLLPTPITSRKVRKDLPSTVGYGPFPAPGGKGMGGYGVVRLIENDIENK